MVQNRTFIESYINNQINRYYHIVITVDFDFFDIIAQIQEQGCYIINSIDLDGYFRNIRRLAGIYSDDEDDVLDLRDTFVFRLAIAFQNQNQIDEFEEFLDNVPMVYGIINQNEFLNIPVNAYVLERENYE